MDTNNLSYGIEAIQHLEGTEAIRKVPGMYIGSTGLEGVKQIVLEIISNAVDEYLNGYCTSCSVIVGEDDDFDIIDDGRGVPFGKQPDGTETLVNTFTQLHTGAKFDNEGNAGYNTSGGMHGVGAKATNALSFFFNVSSVRDGKNCIACFKQGQLLGDVLVRDWPKDNQYQHGTRVQFLPDEEIFKEGITLDYNDLKNTLKELSYLSPGLTFHFKYKDKPSEDITSQNGLVDYIKDLNKNKTVLTSIFYAEKMEDKIGVKIAMDYTDSYSDTYKLYTNSIPNTSGTHLTGFRTALTQSINEYARAKNFLKDKDGNLTGEELKEGLTLILSFVMPEPVYSGQTKGVLSSSEARTMVQRLTAQELKIWFESHPNDAKAIIDKALLARTAREKAKTAKETVRKQDVKKRAVLPGTLADASSKNRSECEVFIVEGKSAAGSTKEARDRIKQAVLPVRGKILNTLKVDLHKALSNAEISAMIDAFGLEVKDGKVIVDTNKLRYGKIIITADADVDGSHIRVLFLTFIWKFAPELIENGYVYAAVPPLYKATIGTKFKYLKDDAELEAFRKSTTRNFELGRMKGLGEMDPSEMAETVMNPETRILKQITMDDIAEVSKVFNDLMGSSVTPRKKFIEENAWRANVDV